MSKPTPKSAQTPTAVPETKPLTLVGLQQTPEGWVAVSATVKGEVSVKQHCPPQPKQFAAGVLRKLLTAKVLFPGGR